MPAIRPSSAVVLITAAFLATGGIGWLIQGLLAWDFFRTMTGGYTLAMALWLVLAWRDERRPRAPEDPEPPSTTKDS
jgi:uncharacterized membrane protein YfcA